jgi:aquaporin Z
MEAAGLGLFMVAAGLFATLLEAPASPLRAELGDPLLRRALMGLAMGATAVGLIYSPWGRRSGAHLNPAVTWTFWRLGKVEGADALLYPLAQLAGGLVGVLLVAALAGAPFTTPPVDWAATRPGPRGEGAAFVAEVAISALMMGAVLVISNRERWRRFTGFAAGALVALYITFEAPLSGMSLNPARTLASAIPAGDFSALWVYLAAPLLGMLLAAELYLRLPASRAVRCAKLHHDDSSPCPFRCGYCRHETEKA